MPHSRREFLKRFSTALGLMTVQPTVAFEAAAPVAAAAPAAVVIPPIKEMSSALGAISMRVGFLHTGVHSGKKATMEAVDEVMTLHRTFWDKALNTGLEAYTPEQMAAAMVNDISANNPDVLNGDLPPELQNDPEMVEFARGQRQSTIDFHSSILNQGMEYAAKTEAELLELAMERAADGYAHWKKITPGRWQEFERRIESGEDLSKPYDHSPKSAKTPKQMVAITADATSHEKLEALLASEDVSVKKHGKSLQLRSFDKKLIKHAAELIQQDTMGKVQAGKFSIVVDEPNHTLMSLARPYIEEYRHSKAPERGA